MDSALDHFYFWLHFIIILFNLTGWIWKSTRKAHLIVVAATLFSWLALGLKYGLGYCFLTDWHWEIKRKLGETDLPASFVKYFLDQYTNIDLSANSVDLITGISFAQAVLLSVYFNFFSPGKKTNNRG